MEQEDGTVSITCGGGGGGSGSGGEVLVDTADTLGLYNGGEDVSSSLHHHLHQHHHHHHHHHHNHNGLLTQGDPGGHHHSDNNSHYGRFTVVYWTGSQGCSMRGQGGTGKRAVYEPNGSQRCKQIVCSRTWAIVIVVVFSLLILAIAIIAAFARPGETLCKLQGGAHDQKAALGGAGEEGGSASGGAEEAGAAGAFPWSNVRLPPSVIPLDYDLSLHPNLTTFLFSGKVTILLHVLQPTDFLVLHKKRLNITYHDLMHNDKSSQKVIIEDERYHDKHEQLYLGLGEQLAKRQQYKLVLHFEGELTNSMAGFYRSSYTTSTGETRWLATTQFEPTDARAAFPCFDEPDLKATFRLSMVREKRHISLFNMPSVNTEAYQGGYEVDHFETSVKMSTYLVAFVVCDFRALHNETSRHTKVAVWAPPEQVDQAQFALSAAITALEYYEEFFGIPYPLPKQDLIAIPDFAAGAMENWGLITYRMSALLYDPSESMAADQERVAIVEAHELAHQWFGNLVTMKWWNDLWLNEGFASFVEYIGADRINPEWRLPEQFVTDALLQALHEDSLINSHPILVPVNDPGEINEIFDSISYSKGASIIRMLESVITRENLQRGLQDYLNQYKFSNARTDDLWEALSRASTIPVKPVMDTWTLQMGYPMLEVTRTKHNTNTVIAQQQRFLLLPDGNDTTGFVSPFDYKWKIPLTYVTDKSNRRSSTIHWIDQDSVSFEISHDARWVKANVNFTGYYRVHYNPENWEALAQQLQEDHTVLSVPDRVELIDDAFAMATAGHHSATVALQLSNYLVKETEYLPWKTALMNYHKLEALIETQDAFKYYQSYMQTQLSSIIGYLGWEDRGNYFHQLLRSIVLEEAIAVNLPSAVQHARTLFEKWMNGTKIPKELKKVVYTAGIKYGGAREWDFCWNRYQTTQVASEKSHLLKALAATSDASTLNRYLHMTLEEDKVRKQDTTKTIVYIAESAAGRVLAWRFIKQNWAVFDKRYGGGSFDMLDLIKGVIDNFATQYDHDEVAAFFAAHPTQVGKRAVAQALEGIQLNVRWLANHEEAVTSWFKNKSPDVSR